MPEFQLLAAIQTQTFHTQGGRIYYPIVHVLNQHAESLINHAITTAVNQLIAEQKNYQSGTHPEVVGHYEIKTNERGILSLILTNYTYSHPMAHGMTLAKSLTFNINTGHMYTLPELFKSRADYVDILSKLVALQIKARKLPLLGPFTGIAPYQEFYLADKALVIYFKLYDITPYYVGFPMFPISVYDLQPYIAPNGPLDILAASIA